MERKQRGMRSLEEEENEQSYPAWETRLPQRKIHKTGWNLIQKHLATTHIQTNTTQYVNKAVGWAKRRVQVCRALVMANSKIRFLWLCCSGGLNYCHQCKVWICISHDHQSDNPSIYTISGQEMNLLWDGVRRQDKWTVPAGVKVKDWTAKQEDREVVC